MSMPPLKKDDDRDVARYLETLFDVVIEEAQANPDFANRLRSALSDSLAAPTSKDARQPARKRRTTASSVPAIHAVNILRQHGEQMLRGRLSNLRTKAELAAVAKNSALRLTGPAAKKSASREEIVEGIVIAAQQYDSQRESVAG
ncbi:MAG: hypothetical protein AAGJ70_14045 [Pseudomonadota bacterium]